MKKYIPWIIVGILIIMGFSSYNGLVKKEEEVKRLWSNVESQYQRRADLIPNLVESVKGEVAFEQKTLTDVIQARASATQVKIDASSLTPENMAAFQQAQSGLSGALGRLLAVAENYPTLQANEAFRGLRDDLAGTENRINKARDDFNAGVNIYNSSRRTFPTVLFSGLMGFGEKGYFEADAGSEKAPAVKF